MFVIYYYDKYDSYGNPRYKNEMYDYQLTKHWLHSFVKTDGFWLIPGTWNEE